MTKSKRNRYIILAFIFGIFFTITIIWKNNKSDTPLIAIANYGPHASLEESIEGIKDELKHAGYIENKNIRFVIEHVSFDQTLINQMLTKLKSLEPKMIIAISTPVAQSAKNLIKEIPVIYSVVTDPMEAGLIKDPYTPDQNVTGSSEKQNLNLFLAFAKQILPHANKVGLLYSTSESNDTALLNMLTQSAAGMGMEIVSVPVDQPRDVQQRMQLFNGKADFIYLGASSITLPVLPAIVSEAKKMNIPVFSADSQDVKNHHVLGSFGVNYYGVGVNTGKLATKILQGESVANLKPTYPSQEDHQGYLSKKFMKIYDINSRNIQKNIKIMD